MHDFDAGVAASAPIAADLKVHMDPNEVCRMCFTSGTTGNPKCALHSFNTTLYAVQLLNNACSVGAEVFLVFLPLGLNWATLRCCRAFWPGHARADGAFNPRAALELIQNERAPIFQPRQPGLVGMLNAPGARRSTSLRCAWSSQAALRQRSRRSATTRSG